MTLSVVFSAASLIICGFSFIYLLGYLRRRTGAERILEDFEEEVNKIIAGIDAATDRDITLIEDKAKAVKELIETLDRRIVANTREQNRRNTQEAALNALAGESAAGKPGLRTNAARTDGALTEDAYAALGRGRGLRSTLKVGPPAPDTHPEPVPSADPAVSAFPEAETGQSAGPRFIRSSKPVKSKTPLTERVLELSRNGFSAETIAARLEVTIAEVDLALAMSDRRNNGY